MASTRVASVSEGFGWLDKDRKVAQRDMARAYGFVHRPAKKVSEKPATSSRTTAQTIGHRIGPDDVPPSNGEYLDDVNPATGDVLCKIPRGNAQDVGRAVAAAKNAQTSWSAMPLASRCAILRKAADRIEARTEKLARLESQDTGKPITQSTNLDIARSVRNFRFFADFAEKETREEHPMDGHLNYTVRAAVGIVGLITPWNLPLYLLTWKTAPALAMGNAIVAKPSELTPQTADALAGILLEAGLPPGVFNVVQGYGHEAGQALVEHPDVKAISFTGGTVTGRKVAGTAAPLLKKVSLELGGKNASIVLADCDMEEAVADVVRSGFSNTGQICLCGSRILVESNIEAEFTKRLVERVTAMKLGDPLDADTELGPLVSATHREKVESYIASAKQEGGNVLNGGKRPDPASLPASHRNGAYLEPTIITGLAQTSRCVQEEIFGPVITIQPFKDENEAIALANGVRYGLAASVWTRDEAKGQRVAEALQTGMVWINCWLVRDLRVPFGGMKESGIGREGGRHSLDFFSEPRNICVKT